MKYNKRVARRLQELAQREAISGYTTTQAGCIDALAAIYSVNLNTLALASSLTRYKLVRMNGSAPGQTDGRGAARSGDITAIAGALEVDATDLAKYLTTGTASA
jgi:hypothetical protein|tara:strand:+ start:3270 stop:3581 length:312 start_codon:yes stop_codon:yes gene_type:complete